MTDSHTQNEPTVTSFMKSVSTSRKRPHPSPTPPARRMVSRPTVIHNKDCRVILHGILKYPSAALSKTTNEVNELKLKVSQLEALLVPLRPLIALTNASNPSDHKLLLDAAGLIDALSAEIEQCLRYKRQLIIYNVPDRVPAEKAKQAILLITGLKDKVCRCVRLRKASPRLCCPLLLEFMDEASAAALLRQQEALTRHPMLSGASSHLPILPYRGSLETMKAPNQTYQQPPLYAPRNALCAPIGKTNLMAYLL